MLYEMRTYTTPAGKAPVLANLSAEIARSIRGDRRRTFPDLNPFNFNTFLKESVGVHDPICRGHHERRGDPHAGALSPHRHPDERDDPVVGEQCADALAFRVATDDAHERRPGRDHATTVAAAGDPRRAVWLTPGRRRPVVSSR